MCTVYIYRITETAAVEQQGYRRRMGKRDVRGGESRKGPTRGRGWWDRGSLAVSARKRLTLGARSAYNNTLR